LYVDNGRFGQVKFDFLIKTNGIIRITDGECKTFMKKTGFFGCGGGGSTILLDSQSPRYKNVRKIIGEISRRNPSITEKILYLQGE
jgi:hypothetical protein